MELLEARALMAVIDISASGTYTQNFNTLLTSGTGTWSDDSTIASWYSQRSGTGTSIAADAGSDTSGNLYSYGTGTNTDRALGTVGSGDDLAGNFAHGLQLHNATASAATIGAFSYVGEQWRNGDNTTANVITFWYRTSSTPITELTPGEDTTWTAVSALDFSSPINTSPAEALDGNATENKVAKSSANLNISVPAGNYIMFRWSDPDHSGNDHGLAIDDVSVSYTATAAIPTITGAATATAFTTTYGAPSAAQSFSVTGTNLTADLVATAPTGFQVSSDATTFGSFASFTPTSGSVSGSLSVRFAANAPVSGSYNSQSIVLSSTGATDVNITSTVSGNTVTAKALTISGISAASKTYNGNTTASLIGTATYSGLVNSESFTVTGTPSANFANANVGNAKSVTVSGYTAPSSNYTLTQPTGLSANITAAPLTVTASNASKTYGQTFVGTAFTSSGLVGGETIGSVTLSSTGAAATAGVATYAIVPSAATGGTFAAANYSITYANGSLTVNKAPLTITANNASKTYGQSFSPGSGAFTTSGLVNGDTIVAVSQSSSGSSPTSGVANSPYPIELSSAVGIGSYSASNYNIIYVYGSLTVNAAPLTITAGAKSKIYGATDPVLTYGASGLLFGDTASGSLTRVAGNNVGTYAIQQGTVTAGTNYTISYVGANLSITPKTLTVTADVKTKIYGAADPVLTYVTSGLVNGDAASGSLARVPGENVGTYAIQQGTVTAGTNYTISYVGANLSITPKALTVTADVKSKIYGAADPVLTYVTSGLVNGDAASGSLTRVPGANVGTYAIQQGTVTAGTNYTISYVGANLSITPKALTVTADAKTKAAGSSDPALTFTTSGLTNGDTAGTALSGSLTRAAGEAPGIYAITQGTLTAVAGNYDITYLGANLSITVSINSVAVNGADTYLKASQRSQITSLVVTLSAQVTNPATAFTITNVGLYANSPETTNNTVLSSGQILVTNVGNVYTIRFGAGTSVDARQGSGVKGNSLADGNYRLNVAFGANAFGAVAADNFFRMFGDSDGDGDVDGTDTLAFRAAQSTYNAALDWEGDGAVSGTGTDATKKTANSGKIRRLF